MKRNFIHAGPTLSSYVPSSKAASVQTRRHRGGSGGLRCARRPHRKPLESRQPHGKSRMILNELARVLESILKQTTDYVCASSDV